ncbi:MAG: alpha-2-macroglobulin family protein [Planctomycetota bacterium]
MVPGAAAHRRHLPVPLGQPGRAQRRVIAQAWVHAAEAGTTNLPLAADGLSILVDQDQLGEGETAQILVVSDATDRYVLFSVEAETIQHIEVLHLTGNVKLVPLALTEEHVPNVTLFAQEVRNAGLRQASQELIVAPKRHFLNVEVALDRESYAPGDKGTFTVTVTDHEGKPVEVELSLSLFDGSLLAISPDRIPDPREFFFGHKRVHRVGGSSSLQERNYVTLVADEQGRLMTPDQLLSLQENLRWEAEGKGAWQTGKAETGNLLEVTRDTAATSQFEVGYLGSMEDSAPGAPMERARMAKGMVAGDELAAPAAAPNPEPAGRPDGGDPQPGGTITVRSDFRETAMWLPDVLTGADGKASGSFTLPESTTRWRIQAVAGDQGSRFGIERRDGARTELPLIVRPQMPRFLVQGDQARLAALLTNTTDTPIEATVEIDTEGLVVLGHFADGELKQGHQVPVRVPAHGDLRVDFLVEPHGPQHELTLGPPARDKDGKPVRPFAGLAKVTMTARGKEYSDAALRTLPVIEHGIEVFVSDTGRMTQATLDHEFELPAGAPGTVRFEIQVAPSIASSMLDALPYLTHYPYGCLEQSLSRFVPTAIAMDTMKRMGLDPEWVAAASFGGVNAEFAARTQPLGREPVEKWQEIARAGLAKVEGEQKGDGSWSWWPGGPSNPWMSAYAVWSLALAKNAGLETSDAVLIQGRNWLLNTLPEANMEPNQRAWLLHAALAANGALGQKEGTPVLTAAFETVFGARDGLTAYGRALLAMAGKALGRSELPVLVDNLRNGVVFTDPGQSGISGTSGGARDRTAHWGSTGVYWHWREGAVESTALTLMALMQCDPGNELVVPTMQWLVANRRGAQWNSTRDTAFCVMALCRYLEGSGEVAQPVAFRVSLGKQVLGETRLEGRQLLLGRTSFVVPTETAGRHRIRIERTEGSGLLYRSVQARLFSAEEPIQARASDVFIRRDVFRLVGRETLLAGKVFERVHLKDGDAVQSGDRLEVVLTVHAPNDPST